MRRTFRATPQISHRSSRPTVRRLAGKWVGLDVPRLVGSLVRRQELGRLIARHVASIAVFLAPTLRSARPPLAYRCSRCFRSVFGETPHCYLQRRRIERSMFLLRETDRSVTDICFEVDFVSLGSFSRTFRAIVGEAP